MPFVIVSLVVWVAFTTLFYVAASIIVENLDFIRQHSFVQTEGRAERLDDLIKSPATSRILSLGGGFFGLLLGLNLGLGIAVTVALCGAGAMAPVLYLARRERKRRQLLEGQIVVALTTIGDAMRAGKTLPQAIDGAAAAIERPMSLELAVVSRQLRVGIKAEDALRDLSTRLNLPDLKLAVKAMVVSIRTGANLPQAIRRIVETIANRSRVESKVRVLTTQGKMQGMIVGLAPFALLLGFWMLNPSYVGALFKTTLGNIILGTIFVLQTAAALVMRQITSVKV
jgi:tight adherence protein B